MSLFGNGTKSNKGVCVGVFVPKLNKTSARVLYSNPLTLSFPSLPFLHNSPVN